MNSWFFEALKTVCARRRDADWFREKGAEPDSKNGKFHAPKLGLARVGRAGTDSRGKGLDFPVDLSPKGASNFDGRRMAQRDRSIIPKDEYLPTEGALDVKAASCPRGVLRPPAV
ncbi:unnamed protein product [Bursaphelenchus xylophilus]|uniref:(pine wood nematode) hypothetical protein n=1 Tax=Bursaphelenchus xylophilus TaxID=6326 RepID=A0A1I7STM8_BURXY|nr:unnamed protein product [Bursaphelenchus xylophilus]CAG9108204.1 unnamed protein product [Bursaphelenchus xylophilus]